jgi:hypothetical protein
MQMKNPVWLRILVVVLFVLSCAAWLSAVVSGELSDRKAFAALSLPLLAFAIMRPTEDGTKTNGDMGCRARFRTCFRPAMNQANV